jgi:carbamate kinase
MDRTSLIVVALGGNAISRPDQEGNVAEQFENSRRTAAALVDLVEEGHQLLITHGNGPQIGNFLMRNEFSAGKIYPLPMEVAVAHVQGGMGFMIAQAMMNELSSRGLPRIVTAMVTTVLVDRNDPSFENPTKPIGRVLTREEAEAQARQEGWQIKEVSAGKFRRVVASPAPRQIMEIETVKLIVDSGGLLIACGGGGVPVIRDENGELRGTRAVIDKDLAGAFLAAQLDADAMMILTNVERVFINYGKPDQKALDRMTLADARRYLAEGQFPAGSMGPKVQGAVNFLESSRKPGARVIIGPLEHARDAVAGRMGTCIHKGAG